MKEQYGYLDHETRGLISDQLKISGMQSLSSSFAEMANAQINYGALKTEAGNLNITADTIELQAQEEANNLRRQFISAIGSATYNAATRGVKVTSANLQDNIQRSAGELDEDIKKKKKNAERRATGLRLEAKLKKRSAKAMRVQGMLNGISNLMSGIATYNAGSAIAGGGDISSGSNWNPSKAAPSRKPMGR